MSWLQVKRISQNGSYGNHKFTFAVYEDSIDVARNISICSLYITMEHIGAGTHGWDWQGDAVTIQANLAGTPYRNVIKYYDGVTTVNVLKVENIEIQHNADGSKTVDFDFKVASFEGVKYLPGNASGSGTMELTNISRKAVLTGAENFRNGESPTIYYDCKNPSIVDALDTCISFDGKNEGIPYRSVDKYGSSYTYYLSTEEEQMLVNACRGSSSTTVTFFLRTTINGTYYYSTLDKTFSMSNNGPSIRPTVRETNQKYINLTGSDQIIIKGYNAVQASMNATPQTGTTLSETSISNGYNGVNGTDTVFKNTTSNVFDFYAKDDRWNASSRRVVLRMIDYFKPTCTATVVPPNEYGRMKINASGNFFNQSFGAVANTLTVKYRIMEVGGTFGQWNAMTVTLGQNTYTASIEVTGLNYQKQYKVQVQADDKLDSANSDDKQISSIPMFDFGFNQKTKEVDFNFNVPVRFYGELLRDMTHPVGSIYMSMEDTDPAILFGGTWVRIQDVFLLAAGSRSAGARGGEEWHTLTEYEIPNHSHSITKPTGEFSWSDTDGGWANFRTGSSTTIGSDLYTGFTGGGEPHNNMPPYLTVYVWKRTQ